MLIQSSSLRITSRPTRQEIGIVVPTAAVFTLDHAIEAVGTVTFGGRHGETSAAGWTVAFRQVEWSDNSWAVYRGASQAAGSVFVQRSRPPARPFQACADTTGPNQQFYGSAEDKPRKPVGGSNVLPFVASVPTGAALPLEVNALHSDMPQNLFFWELTNGVTGQKNLLREAQLEFMFCTVLVARDPLGEIHMLRGFYWNVAWQAEFPVHAHSTRHTKAVARGTHVHVGHVFAGPPVDPRFLSVLTRPQAMTCNDMLHSSALNPNVQEVVGWPEFDVRR